MRRVITDREALKVKLVPQVFRKFSMTFSQGKVRCKPMMAEISALYSVIEPGIYSRPSSHWHVPGDAIQSAVRKYQARRAVYSECIP